MVYLVGIAGGSGSGKSTVAGLIQQHLKLWGVTTAILSMDDCYRDFSGLDEEQRAALCFNPELNYDHPHSVDFGRLEDYLHQLNSGQRFEYPQYDFARHCHGTNFVSVPQNVEVGIVEGIFALYSGQPVERGLIDLYDEGLFVVTSPEIAQLRRISRDLTERGRELGHVRRQLEQTVIPMYRRFVLPTADNATDVINWQIHTADNDAMKRKLFAIARQKALSIYERVRSPVLAELASDDFSFGG